MTQAIPEKSYWMTADLAALPYDCNTYEIINGELFVTGLPTWYHQGVIGKILIALKHWSMSTGLGEAVISPGVIFSDIDSVIPDGVWVTNETLSALLNENGHLTGAPELVMEV